MPSWRLASGCMHAWRSAGIRQRPSTPHPPFFRGLPQRGDLYGRRAAFTPGQHLRYRAGARGSVPAGCARPCAREPPFSKHNSAFHPWNGGGEVGFTRALTGVVFHPAWSEMREGPGAWLHVIARPQFMSTGAKKLSYPLYVENFFNL